MVELNWIYFSLKMENTMALSLSILRLPPYIKIDALCP
jgi:hypothetical protein